MSKMPQGRVNHAAKLPKFIADLHTSQKFSDVKIKVGREVFLGHSLLLGGQSTFFERKFFTEGKKEVFLPNTTALVFRDVLGYFYTGQIEFQTQVKNYIPDLVELTELLGLQSLQKDVVDDTCAHMLSDEPVPEDVLEFYDQEAEVLISTEMFKILTLNRLQELLSRDTFYVEKELDVFKAVMEWGKGRPEDERKAGLSTVRLALIQDHLLFNEARKAKEFTDTEILDAIESQRLGSHLRRREPTRPKCNVATPGSVSLPKLLNIETVPESNVATPELGAEVLSGANPEHLLDQADHAYSATSGFTSHGLKAEGEQKGIVVKLDKVYKINSVKVHILDKDARVFSYYVDVSRKQDGPWHRVIDYTKYHCRGHQLLHFDPTPAQYVRLVGTACTQGDVFAVVSLQCYFTDTPLAVTQGLIEPRENQSLSTRGALVVECSSGGRGMLRGVADGSGYSYGAPNITVVLSQPVLIGSLRFQLQPNFEYRYTVEVSTDRQTWRQVADKTHTACRDWQSLTFDKTPASYFRFHCTTSNISRYIHIRYLEVPDQTV